MKTSTNSYFFVPLFPNPFKRFEVDSQRRLRIYGITGEKENIDLNGLSSKTWFKFLPNYVCGTGNLVLTGSSVGSSELTLRNLYSVRTFRRALDGVLPEKSHNQPEVQVEPPVKRDLNDNDIQKNEVLYFPHIPKTIKVLLESHEPENFKFKVMEFKVNEGDFVFKHDVIGNWGKIELTAPFDGKVISLGSKETGTYDWPNATKSSDMIEHSNRQDVKKFYAFAINPSKEVHLHGRNKTFGVRWAFNHGEVWLDMKRSIGYTFYTYIDMAVYHLKDPNNGLEVPSNLKEDDDFREQLMGYWSLINNGDAYNPKHKDKNG